MGVDNTPPHPALEAHTMNPLDNMIGRLRYELVREQQRVDNAKYGTTPPTPTPWADTIKLKLVRATLNLIP